MNEIEKTSLWVAGIRALEQENINPLFTDPFARMLVDDEIFLENLRRAYADEKIMPPAIQVRTRWLDDEILLAAEHGIRQVVNLAAGMDARTYRLSWPKETRVYELDHVDVVQYKRTKLAEYKPTCDQCAIAVDLRSDWPNDLIQHSFNPKIPTLWLIEGLLCYLKETQVNQLFTRINSISSKNSIALFDVIGLSMLNSSKANLLHDLAQQFGTDEPETLLKSLEWVNTVYTIAEIGQQLGRWPFPVPRRGTRGIPQSFLVHAMKQ